MKLGWQHAAVTATLFVFGLAYNWFIEEIERRGLDRGYTALLVVAGVAVTVTVTIPLIGLEAAVTLTLAFVASGMPMIVGSILRHVRERAQEEEINRQRAIEELASGDTA